MKFTKNQKITISICGLLMTLLNGCTSFNDYKYAVEGQPIIATPTQFPAADQANVDYQNQVVISDSKFYNSYWFGNNIANLDINSSDFNLVSKYNINYLKNNKDAKIQINGFASDLGSKSGNLNLSINRANFVKKYYVSQGVSSEQILVKGYGNSILIYPETNNQNNPSNRRVDIIYIDNQPKEYSNLDKKPIINTLKTNIEMDQEKDNN